MPTDELFFKNFSFGIISERDEVYIRLGEDCIATIDINSNSLRLNQNSEMFELVNKFILNNQEDFVLLAKTYFDGFRHGALMYC